MGTAQQTTDWIDLRKQVIRKYFNRMNDKQFEAVVTVDGPVLILAGAGSGKTTVVVNRIANMIRFGNAYQDSAIPQLTPEQIGLLHDYLNGSNNDIDAISDIIATGRVRPWNILAITFTNKAAGELKERLSGSLGEMANDICAATFHSACARILRVDIENIGYAGNFTIYDTDDALRVIKNAMAALNINEKVFPPKSIMTEISRAKDKMWSPEEYQSRAGEDYRLNVIAKVYTRYQASLKEANALDFDDIICKTIELFERCPDVLEKYRRRYRYIMVDEYQDTNYAQYRLISLLSQEHHNICVVGDDDQSIYKFRGATIENILHFEDQFENAKVIRLEQNYRSTQRILDAANAVIANNTGRKGKNLWTDNGGGDLIEVFRACDESSEARFVTNTILDDVAKGGEFSDHAILYRMNAQSNALERMMVKQGIPYKIIGGLRFYERKEIKDVLAYMSVVNNTQDALRLRRIINEPKRGIGEATLANAQEIAAGLGITLFEVLKSADSYPALVKKAPVLTKFTMLIETLAEAAEHESLGDFFEILLDETGYRESLQTQGEEGKNRLENIAELKTNILKYEEEAENPSLSGFLEEIALYTDLDDLNQDKDNVIMMTMHSAKGLEFPCVFVIGMEEGLFPSFRAIGSQEELEEERRLAYVAITRAKERLYITNAVVRMLFGNTSRNPISRFIQEIPSSLKDFQDETVVKYQNISAAPTKTSYSFRNDMTSHKKQSASTASAISLAPGDRVRHKIFGDGEVRSLTKMANDMLVEIAFDTKGTKKIMANFAKLEKL